MSDFNNLNNLSNLDKNRYWIWFSLINNLGVRKKRKLLDIYNSPEVIYNLKDEDLLMVEGIGNDTANSIANFKSQKLIDYHI